MYYESLRYLRKLPPTQAFYQYSSTANNDDFPVITDWYRDNDDPIQYLPEELHHRDGESVHPLRQACSRRELCKLWSGTVRGCPLPANGPTKAVSPMHRIRDHPEQMRWLDEPE